VVVGAVEAVRQLHHLGDAVERRASVEQRLHDRRVGLGRRVRVAPDGVAERARAAGDLFGLLLCAWCVWARRSLASAAPPAALASPPPTHTHKHARKTHRVYVLDRHVEALQGAAGAAVYDKALEVGAVVCALFVVGE
jgi:hypothetical protein